MNSRFRMRLLAAVAALALVVGIALVAVSSQQTASFGWFAYAPLSNAVFTPDGSVLFSRTAIAGAVVIVIGVALATFWAGLLVGRRSAGEPGAATR